MSIKNGIASFLVRISALERRAYSSFGARVSPRSAWQRYALVIVLVAAATAGRWALLPILGTRYPFVTLYPTVLVAAVLAGFGPGLLASALMFVVAAYFWLPKANALAIEDPVDRVATIINFMGTVMVCFFAEVLRRAKFELKQNQLGLEQLVERRTAELRQEVQLRRKTESELREASKAKDRFLATLSHELRTPLNPVLLLATEGAANNELPPEVREDFEVISRNVQLEARLIDDLLDVTRIVHGKTSLYCEPVNVHALLANAVRKVDFDLSARGLALVQKFGATSASVWGDPARLEQVFSNLLTNAAKFTRIGQVSIETATVEDSLVVEISDTGLGMTEEELARVFDPFAQGDHTARTTPSEFTGLGLGLSIVRGLVVLHSGTVEARSEGRNLGATFTVRLPLYRGSSPEKQLPTSPPASAASQPSFGFLHPVLLVEDHKPTRSAVENLLRRRNCEVVGVATADAALAAAANQKFAFVISDIGLPDRDGYELMSLLSARYGLRGIAVTGYGMDEDRARSRAAGFLNHLTKPVTVGALESALLGMQAEIHAAGEASSQSSTENPAR